MNILKQIIFSRLSKIYKNLFKRKSNLHNKLLTIPRNSHDISRTDIHENALKVLYRLHKSGFKAYLVGGCLRDLLLGIEPKDFDIATNARPEQVKRLFKNSRLIGRRFRLAHILFGRDIIEVATLRGHHQEGSPHAKTDDSGRVLRDNVYGSIDEDAERRDFTINAIYYDISDFSLRCHPQTIPDLKSRTLRMIGEPAIRYQEDPVRMLRAIRFATKLDMKLESETKKQISKCASLLTQAHPSRLFDEMAKLLFTQHAVDNFKLIKQFGLLKPLFPLLETELKQANSEQSKTYQMIMAILTELDQEERQSTYDLHTKLYVHLLWYTFQDKARDILNQSGLPPHDAYSTAALQVLEEQCETIAIPKRITTIIRDVWLLQLRLEKGQSPKAFKIIKHNDIELALELLAYRGRIESNHIQKLAQWWQEFIDGDEAARKQLVRKATSHRPKKRSYRHSRKPKKAESEQK